MFATEFSTMKRVLAGLAFTALGLAPALAQSPGYVDSYTFRRQAALTDQFEIQSSRLALERAASPAVIAYAERMIHDHTESSAGLREFSDYPSEFQGLDARDAAMLNELGALEGAAFDRAYADMQRRAHEQAVALYSAYAQNGDWSELRGFARGTLPGLQAHLQAAYRLANRTGER